MLFQAFWYPVIKIPVSHAEFVGTFIIRTVGNWLELFEKEWKGETLEYYLLSII